MLLLSSVVCKLIDEFLAAATVEVAYLCLSVAGVISLFDNQMLLRKYHCIAQSLTMKDLASLETTAIGVDYLCCAYLAVVRYKKDHKSCL